MSGNAHASFHLRTLITLTKRKGSSHCYRVQCFFSLRRPLPQYSLTGVDLGLMLGPCEAVLLLTGDHKLEYLFPKYLEALKGHALPRIELKIACLEGMSSSPRTKNSLARVQGLLIDWLWWPGVSCGKGICFTIELHTSCPSVHSLNRISLKHAASHSPSYLLETLSYTIQRFPFKRHTGLEW